MSINDKIKKAEEVLNAQFNKSIRFALESSDIPSIGCELLNDLAKKNLPDKNKQDEMDIILIGTLVTAAAYQMDKYPNNIFLTTVSLEEGSNFFEEPYYPLRLSSLYDECAAELADCRLDKGDPRFLTIMLLTVGINIMNEELSFEKEKFQYIFPALSQQLEEIAARIGKQSAHRDDLVQHNNYSKIDQVFNDAIKACSAVKDNENKEKFIENLKRLKEKVLTGFRQHKKMFDYDNSISLAKCAHELAAKVGKNDVRERDVRRFKENTAKFSTSRLSTILSALIIAALTLVAGAVAGFFVGGIPGAAIGAAAGLAVGGIVASGTFWHKRKHDPLTQFSDAAEKLIISNKR